MSNAKTETLVNLRSKFMTQSMNDEGMNRFGYFSFPRAGVIGDGNYDFKNCKLYFCPKIADKKVDTNGKVLTQPRGIFPGALRQGKSESSFFSKSGYITIGDPYVDPSAIERRYQNARKKKFPHEADFKPASGTKTDPIAAIYEHKSDGIAEKKVNHRGQDGRVITQPKNITTNPPKEGHGWSTIGHLFSKPAEHIKDEYDRRRQLEYQEHIENRKKLQEAAFKPPNLYGKPFSNDREYYGYERPERTESPKKKFEPRKFHGDGAFKPAGCTNDYINPFPEYKADPIHIALRQHVGSGNKKDPFK